MLRPCHSKSTFSRVVCLVKFLRVDSPLYGISEGFLPDVESQAGRVSGDPDLHRKRKRPAKAEAYPNATILEARIRLVLFTNIHRREYPQKDTPCASTILSIGIIDWKPYKGLHPQPPNKGLGRSGSPSLKN